MGVYIKGMELPTEQYGKMVITLYPNGHIAEYVGDMGRVWEAIPVPAHGRLIDADEKIRVQIYDDMTEDYHMVEMTIDDLLSQGWVEADAPTIIPAEEGE